MNIDFWDGDKGEESLLVYNAAMATGRQVTAAVSRTTLYRLLGVRSLATGTHSYKEWQ